jgi:hypothetical protein
MGAPCARYDGSASLSKLLPGEIRVEPATAHQFLVGAALHDSTVLNHEDLIGGADRGQAMGHHH